MWSSSRSASFNPFDRKMHISLIFWSPCWKPMTVRGCFNEDEERGKPYEKWTQIVPPPYPGVEPRISWSPIGDPLGLPRLLGTRSCSISRSRYQFGWSRHRKQSEYVSGDLFGLCQFVGLWLVVSYDWFKWRCSERVTTESALRSNLAT